MSDVHYPLLFTYRDTIRTDAFAVQVVTYGRSLLVQESEGCWVYGVSPGPIAESGSTADEALTKFRSAWRGVLTDMALDAPTLDAYRADVEKVFASCDPETLREWDVAVQLVRAGKVSSDLPRVNAESATIKIEVRAIPQPGLLPGVDKALNDVLPAVAA